MCPFNVAVLVSRVSAMASVPIPSCSIWITACCLLVN